MRRNTSLSLVVVAVISMPIVGFYLFFKLTNILPGMIDPDPTLNRDSINIYYDVGDFDEEKYELINTQKE